MLPIVLHWNGKEWRHMLPQDQVGHDIRLYDILALSNDDVWAVGNSIKHWDGTKWETFFPYFADNIYAIDGVDADDIWVAGRRIGQNLTMHWDGRTWNEVSIPKSGERNELRTLEVISSGEAWAVGYSTPIDGSTITLQIVHWDGKSWTQDVGFRHLPLYNPRLDTITSVDGELWIAGSYHPEPPSYPDPGQPLILHRTNMPCRDTYPSNPLDPPVPLPGAASRVFPETGKAMSGIFLDYWDSHGGLAQQGYPISGVIGEMSPLDGKVYTVQYTERAVFEYHPENQAPYEVLLSQLGTLRYRERYPNGAPIQVPTVAPGSILFPETGKRVGGKFLEYWQRNGGLAQQGFPISDEFVEVSDLDGKPYLVQYFERAVFEMHPENVGTPYEVLLSQLGTFRHKEKYGR
jgi:hypothetical protein